MITYLKYDANDELIKLAKRLTGYTGKKYSVVTHDGDTYRIADSYWSGGSRTLSHVVKVDGMEAAAIPSFHPFFDGQVIPESVKWDRGIIVVEYAQGYCEGIRFVVHPLDWESRALPEVPELTFIENLVLVMTSGLTSAGRKNDRERYGITDADWESGKESLIGKGLLQKNGAVTVDGRNVANTLDRYTLQNEYAKRYDCPICGGKMRRGQCYTCDRPQ